jgi:hypothetical protein
MTGGGEKVVMHSGDYRITYILIANITPIREKKNFLLTLKTEEGVAKAFCRPKYSSSYIY